MLIENELALPVPPAEAWPVLLDLERIAPCLPGAEITGVDGEMFEGRAKIKVGPIIAEYKGVAEFVERDEGSYQATIKATGKDARGQGNASANITASLVPEGSGSKVLVETDLNITGKLAQFGQGVIQDAAAGIITTFAERLAELMTARAGQASSAGTPPSPDQTGGAAAPRATSGGDETLDVLKIARGASTSRLTASRVAAAVSVVAGGVSVAAAASRARPSAVAVVAAGIGSFAAGYSLGRESS